jgi:protein-S-isoprenylcysteine O-methyltransferase Ste14
LAEWLFLWTGGAIFVVSLVVCAASYLFSWSADTGSGWIAVVPDALLVTLFASHHSVFARDRVKVWLEALVPRRLLRSVYVWFASLLLLGMCGAWRPIGHEVFRVTGLQIWLHAFVQLLGIAIIARVVRDLDPLELAGIRQTSAAPAIPPGNQRGTSNRQASKLEAAATAGHTSNDSPAASDRPTSDQHKLTTGGPYGLVRHPLYFGWMLCVFGAAHMTGDRLAFAVYTTLYLVIAIPWEERSLIGEFGDEYRRYQQVVRWRMIPFIY